MPPIPAGAYCLDRGLRYTEMLGHPAPIIRTLGGADFPNSRFSEDCTWAGFSPTMRSVMKAIRLILGGRPIVEIERPIIRTSPVAVSRLLADRTWAVKRFRHQPVNVFRGLVSHHGVPIRPEVR